MSTVTLINPPGIKTFSSIQMQTPNPPIGTAYIAGTLKRAGIPYKCIDAVGDGMETITAYHRRADMKMQGLTVQQIIERIPADADIIGITCLFSTLWPISRDLAEEIRRAFPKSLLVLGSEHGTAVPEYSLRSSVFDMIALGEGIETMLDIVELWRTHGANRAEWAKVKGLAYLDGDKFVSTGLAARKRDVDDIPLPDWDAIPIKEYIDRHQINGANIGRSMPLLATWGCHYQCTFCSNPGMWTQRWIPRNPKLVVDEMELYRDKYNVTNFDFQDLTAMIRRSWIIDFTQELIDRKLGVTWQLPSGTRAEVFDKEVAERLYAAGLRLLSFAPESGSDKMLKLIKKQVDIPKMLHAMREAIDANLKLSCFIVIGFPGETRETIAETMKLVRKMAWMGVHDVAVTKFVPYPGSQLFKELQEQGKLGLDDEFFIMPMDFYTAKAPSFVEGMTSRYLYWTMMAMFSNFYAISMIRRPWRFIGAVWSVFQGVESTRFAKWLNDVFVVRRKWNRRYKELAHQADA
jgi:anaerobic magnesium-protoporphyrin IX monomethyl ester cyclase